MFKRRVLLVLLASCVLAGSGLLPRARADHDALNSLRGKVWAINFIVPRSPKGNDFGQPHRHKFEFRQEGEKLSVRAREILGILVPGAWRASGNQFSAAFEFSCEPNAVCGTVLMRGTIDEDDMSGEVFVLWDERDETTPTGLDTSRGTFTGELCGNIGSSSVSPSHDTGGCEAP